MNQTLKLKDRNWQNKKINKEATKLYTRDLLYKFRKGLLTFRKAANNLKVKYARDIPCQQ